jgi:hypothetical protein
MSLTHQVELRTGYAVVRVEGEPTLGEFHAFIEAIAGESRTWPVKRALFDLRSVRTLTTFTEHYSVGEQVVRHLHHLHRIASVVPGDRITRASEKTARQSGVNLTVFTSEAEAIAWLQE